MPLTILRFLSFQVGHQISEWIIFQTPKAKHFFILLLLATNKFLTFKGCTQATPINESPKCQSEETQRQRTRRWWTNSSSSRHKAHPLGPWKFHLLRKSFVGTFSFLVAQAKESFRRSFWPLNGYSKKIKAPRPILKSITKTLDIEGPL